MCKFFSVSRSGYYAFLKRLDIPDRDLPLAEKIRECQEQNRNTYGYRRVHIWLERQGIYRNPKTVLRVMQKYNLLSVVRRKKFKYVSEHRACKICAEQGLQKIHTVAEKSIRSAEPYSLSVTQGTVPCVHIVNNSCYHTAIIRITYRIETSQVKSINHRLLCETFSH